MQRKYKCTSKESHSAYHVERQIDIQLRFKQDYLLDVVNIPGKVYL